MSRSDERFPVDELYEWASAGVAYDYEPEPDSQEIGECTAEARAFDRKYHAQHQKVSPW